MHDKPSEPAPALRDLPGRGRWSRGSAVAAGLAIAGLWALGTSVSFKGIAAKLVALDALAGVLFGVLLGCAGLLWLLLGMRLSRRTRMICAAVAIGGVCLLRLLVRIDGYYGNLLPILTWRWTPTRAERMQQFLATHDSRSPAAAAGLPESRRVNLATSSGPAYPGFLGADRHGVVRGLALARDWSVRPPRELWRHAVGFGWSACAVQGEYFVTQEQRGPEEAVVCYELRTGRECWVHADRTVFKEDHGDGPRATPTIHRGRVYALGATGLLNCLEGATGRKIWQRALLGRTGAQNLAWGMAGSPLIAGETVIVSPGLAGRSLVAYRLEDGREVWAAGDDPAAYGSPQLAVLAGVRQVLILNGAGLTGHDAATGKVLWSFPWVTQGDQRVNTTQPIVLADYGYRAGGYPAGTDQVFISSGYGMGCGLLQIACSEGGFTVREIWRNRNLKSKFSNMVVHGRHLYGFDDGILACLDLADGSRCWKGGRYGHGQLVLVDDLLLIQAESGEVVLVEPSPEKLVELGRLPALSSKTWNHLAVAGNILLVRNDLEAACYELPLAN